MCILGARTGPVQASMDACPRAAAGCFQHLISRKPLLRQASDEVFDSVAPTSSNPAKLCAINTPIGNGTSGSTLASRVYEQA